MSDVATAADVSRPTLYRRFPTKESLLEAFALYEEAKFDSGLALSLAGKKTEERLDAVLRYVVDFQHTYSLRHMVEDEPGHILQQMTRVLPIVRERLARYFPGPNGDIVASILTRVTLSHALMPDDDPERFLAELRVTAGLSAPAARVEKPAKKQAKR